MYEVKDNAFSFLCIVSVLLTAEKQQYNETNVMHFSFNLLGIKGPYICSPPEGVTQAAFGILRAYNVS
jgi:hypothetical protein